MSTLGRRIAGARIESGLLQKQLAEAVGVSERSVRQWEADGMQPRPDKVRAIAAATGKPLSFFLADATDADAPPVQQDLAAKVAALAARVDAITGPEVPPPSPPVHPGVEALLSAPAQVAALRITDEEAFELRRCTLGDTPITTVEVAKAMLQLMRHNRADKEG